jgi:hypothetical protein
MPCQWYVRGGGEGKWRILIGQSVPPTPFGMAFGRLKETVSRDFRPQFFFHKSMAPRALINTLKYFRILLRIRGENRDYVLTQRYVA